MKKIVLSCTVVLLLLGAVAWWQPSLFGLARSHVSLKIKGQKLGGLASLLERKTGERILVGPGLDDTVNLNIENGTLPEVLDEVADQLGARWTTVYAVYGSAPALKKLESILGTTQDVATVGWTNLTGQAMPIPMTSLAPNQSGLVVNPGGPSFEALPLPDANAEGPENGKVFITRSINGQSGLPSGTLNTQKSSFKINLGEGDSKEALIEQLRASGVDPESETGQALLQKMEGAMAAVKESMAQGQFSTNMVAMPHGQSTIAATVKNPDGSQEIIREDISPERLVLDLKLVKTDTPPVVPLGPGDKAAEILAKQTGGKVAKYYVLQKSRIPAATSRFLKKGPAPAATDLKGQLPTPESMQNDLARQKMDAFRKLTPEQRARRAREIQVFKGVE